MLTNLPFPMLQMNHHIPTFRNYRKNHFLYLGLKIKDFDTTKFKKYLTNEHKIIIPCSDSAVLVWLVSIQKILSEKLLEWILVEA